jgi:hypothetical protein
MSRTALIAKLVEAVRSRASLQKSLGMSGSLTKGLHDVDHHIMHRMHTTSSEHKKRILTNVLDSVKKTRGARYRRYKVTKRIPGIN